MSFTKHEPCPSCGSRDNLARYSEGSAWCFGCHYYERGIESPFVKERDNNYGNNSTTTGLFDFLTDSGVTKSLESRARNWLTKYGVTSKHVARRGFLWDSSREQLLIPFWDREGKLVCVQAKNFNPERTKKAKYYNIGDKSEHFHIDSSSGNTRRALVLVEDAISSLRIGANFDSFTLLGTSIAKTRLNAFRALGYQAIIVWLDDDKWKEATEIANQASLLGFKSTAFFTPEDPKCYNDDFIKLKIEHYLQSVSL